MPRTTTPAPTARAATHAALPVIALLLAAPAALTAADTPAPAPAPAAAARPMVDGYPMDPATGYVDEAPLPEGWPRPQAPGVVNVADLPKTRAVEGPGFWPLLRHIKQGDIAMTAPVVMPAPDAGAAAGRALPDGTMRFLYPSATTTPGPVDDRVRVVESAPERVLRVAYRGQIDTKQSKLMLERLNAAAKERGLTVTGPYRLCGYNGPDVSPENRFWEIHLPVAAAEAAAAPAAAAPAPAPAAAAPAAPTGAAAIP